MNQLDCQSLDKADCGAPIGRYGCGWACSVCTRANESGVTDEDVLNASILHTGRLQPPVESPATGHQPHETGRTK